MKKYLLIIALFVLATMLFPVSVLAEDTDVSVVIASGDTVNANINLTGGNLDVSVNGAGLVNQDDLTMIGQGIGVDLVNLQQAVVGLYKDIYNLSLSLNQQSGINNNDAVTLDIYGKALAKLIEQLNNNNLSIDELQDNLKILSSNIPNVQPIINQLSDNDKKLVTLQNALNNMNNVLSAMANASNSLEARLLTLEKSGVAQNEAQQLQNNAYQAQIDKLTQDNKTLSDNYSNLKDATWVSITLITAILVVIVLTMLRKWKTTVK